MFKTTSKIVAVAAATLALTAGAVQAQTQAVTATVNVQNNLTLAAVNNLDWGVIVAVGDAVNTASIAVDTAGVLQAPATTGAPAVIVVVDNTAESAGNITIADGADGATINVDIQNVVNPTDGTSSFLLDTFLTSFNGAADVAQTAGTPFTIVFDAAVGPNLNTLDIGATITTNSVTFADAAYVGGFDVVFSY